MPLSGTIQDFGVADIFQLISQQVKTGRLTLSNGAESVVVLFRDGAVIHAENVTTPNERLFGNLLVRAEIIDRKQLEGGLEEQERTLKRIGAVLVELGYVDRETVVEFARLQMMETIYGLFSWNRGTYEFESRDIDASPDGVDPVRAEHIVMNGIRMTDEWPVLREQIPSYAWTVERMRPLPPSPARPARNDVLDFTLGGDSDPLGESERVVDNLIAPGRPVQKIIDLSRLGEFETCRALAELMGNGFIRIVKPQAPERRGPTWAERARQFGVAAREGVGLVVAGHGRGAVGCGCPRRAPRTPRAGGRGPSPRAPAGGRQTSGPRARSSRLSLSDRTLSRPTRCPGRRRSSRAHGSGTPGRRGVLLCPSARRFRPRHASALTRL